MDESEERTRRPQEESRSGRWSTSSEPFIGGAAQLIRRSCSAGSTSSAVALVHGVKREGAGARLSRKVKEKWARFHVMRRCVHMLVCWRDDDDANH